MILLDHYILLIMAEILVIAVASAVTSGISISASFVMVGTWLGVDNSTASDEDNGGTKESIRKSKLEAKTDRNNCSSSRGSNSSSTGSVVSLDDSEDSFEDETDR